jgi:hypothetical protein
MPSSTGGSKLKPIFPLGFGAGAGAGANDGASAGASAGAGAVTGGTESETDMGQFAVCDALGLGSGLLGGLTNGPRRGGPRFNNPPALWFTTSTQEEAPTFCACGGVSAVGGASRDRPDFELVVIVSIPDDLIPAPAPAPAPALAPAPAAAAAAVAAPAAPAC